MNLHGIINIVRKSTQQSNEESNQEESAIRQQEQFLLEGSQKIILPSKTSQGRVTPEQQPVSTGERQLQSDKDGSSRSPMRLRPSEQRALSRALQCTEVYVEEGDSNADLFSPLDKGILQNTNDGRQSSAESFEYIPNYNIKKNKNRVAMNKTAFPANKNNSNLALTMFPNQN